MHYMVLLIVSDPQQCPDVLDAWEAAKVPGVTILESTGLGTLRRNAIRDDIPLMPSLSSLFKREEHRHRTIFTVVDSEELVEELIRLSQSVLGDLNSPHNGVLFVLPVSRVVGLQGAKERALRGGEE